MSHQRSTAEESPVEGYEKHRQSYRACVEGCSRQFLSLQSSDDGLRQLQSDLYEQLVAADSIWAKLKVSREQSSTRKKCAAQMQVAVDALKQNLKEQEIVLARIGREMSQLRQSLDEYCHMTEESREEHMHLSAALDQKVKEMRRDIRAMLPGERAAQGSPRAKVGAKEKSSRSSSPSRSRTSPKRSR